MKRSFFAKLAYNAVAAGVRPLFLAQEQNGDASVHGLEWHETADMTWTTGVSDGWPTNGIFRLSHGVDPNLLEAVLQDHMGKSAAVILPPGFFNQKKHNVERSKKIDDIFRRFGYENARTIRLSLCSVKQSFATLSRHASVDLNIKEISYPDVAQTVVPTLCLSMFGGSRIYTSQLASILGCGPRCAAQDRNCAVRFLGAYDRGGGELLGVCGFYCPIGSGTAIELFACTTGSGHKGVLRALHTEVLWRARDAKTEFVVFPTFYDAAAEKFVPIAVFSCDIMAAGERPAWLCLNDDSSKSTTSSGVSMIVTRDPLRGCQQSPFNISISYASLRLETSENQFRGYPTGDGHVRDPATGSEFWDFGMCSYLGLDKFPRMLEAAKKAADDYGLFTVSCRAYVELPLLLETEKLISEKLGGHFLLLPKTHTGSLLWATTTVVAGDVILLDRAVHISVHYAADVAKARGVRVILVPHGDLETTLRVIKTLEPSAHHIWFASDGLHSMFGTMLSPKFVRALLDASPKVHVFVDDAHGFGWTGTGGCGAWLESFPVDERVVVDISLCKAVACGGGGLLFGSKEDYHYALVAGLPGRWTGPLNPFILAAIREFFLWIDTPEGRSRQDHLKELVSTFNERMKKRPDVPVHNYDVLPIKSIHVGTVRRCTEIVNALRKDGFFVCQASFPATARGHAAVRVTFNAAIPIEACHRLCDSIETNCAGLPPFSQSVHDPDLDFLSTTTPEPPQSTATKSK